MLLEVVYFHLKGQNLMPLKSGFVHTDIRLPNICFEMKWNADLGRVVDLSKKVSVNVLSHIYDVQQNNMIGVNMH